MDMDLFPKEKKLNERINKSLNEHIYLLNYSSRILMQFKYIN